MMDEPIRPTIVCLCGSTRFMDTFQAANLQETMKGNIVLSVGCNTHSDQSLFGALPEDEQRIIKERLDTLHLRKIDMADEVLILNLGGYIGESTRRELNYAINLGKTIRYWDAEDLVLTSEPTEAAPGIALERWLYRFRTVDDAARFHGLLEERGEPADWLEREVRTVLAPKAAFPLWHEICRSSAHEAYLSVDRVGR